MSSLSDIHELVRIHSQSRIDIYIDEIHHVHPVRLLKKYLKEENLRFFPLIEYSGSFNRTPDFTMVVTDQSFSSLIGQDAGSIHGHLPEDGFRIHPQSQKKNPLLVITGGGLPGIIYAIHEFVTHFLIHNSDGSITIPIHDVQCSPSLPYRLFWTWDHSTNWYLEQVGIQEIGAMNYYSKPSNGFLKDYKRLIDFMSLHRISGVTVYGFLRDCHGGIESAKELCRYARERGVRILPGVGINAYGGIYWEGNHQYNLSYWLKQHPEYRAVRSQPVAFHIPDLPELYFPENQYTDTACPSKPENARYHEEAIAWLTETFEIGGINFETGDYGVCQCEECTRRRIENDTWSINDMTLLYPRLFEAAKKVRKDLWLVSEAYWDNILNLEAILPLRHLPEDAIYQFCFNRSYWPKLTNELTHEYVTKLPHQKNILRTHMGSQWNKERYEYVADRFAKMMQLASQVGLRGATIFGEVSDLSVSNELNYLAFARFGYDASLTWNEFIKKDLSPILGGEENALQFLLFLQTPQEEKSLEKALAEAHERMRALSGDQYRRWVWLENRLFQKKAMLR